MSVMPSKPTKIAAAVTAWFTRLDDKWPAYIAAGFLVSAVACRIAAAQLRLTHNRHRVSFLRERQCKKLIHSLSEERWVEVVSLSDELEETSQSTTPTDFFSGTQHVVVPLNSILPVSKKCLSAVCSQNEQALNLCTHSILSAAACLKVAAVSIYDPVQSRNVHSKVSEELFQYYTSLRRARGDLLTSADAWNVLVAFLNHCMRCILAVDQRCVAAGGVGELIDGWDRLMAMVVLLRSAKYNLLHDTRLATLKVEKVSRLVHEDLYCVHALRLLILQLDEAAFQKVLRLKDARTSVLAVMHNIAAVVRSAVDLRSVAVFAVGAFSLRGVSEILRSRREACENADILDSLKSVVERSGATSKVMSFWHKQGDQQHQWKAFVPYINCLVSASFVAVTHALAAGLNKYLMNCGLDLLAFYFEQVAALTVNHALEGEVVMRAVLQDFTYLARPHSEGLFDNCGVTNAIEFLVRKFQLSVSVVNACRSLFAFPAAVVAYISTKSVVGELEFQFQMWKEVDQLITDYYRRDFLSATSLLTSVSVSSDVSHPVTRNWLIDEQSIVSNNNTAACVEFASVRLDYLLAAIPDETRPHIAKSKSVAPKRNSDCATAVLGELMRLHGIEISPHFGLSALLLVAFNKEHRCATSTYANSVGNAWGHIAATMEWAVWSRSETVDAIEAIEKVFYLHARSDAAVALLEKNYCATTCHLVRLQQLIKESPPPTKASSTHAAVVLAVQEGPTVVEDHHSSADPGSRPPPLPSLSSAMLRNTRFMASLRNSGNELDFVKACALGEAHIARMGRVDSASSYIQANWIFNCFRAVSEYLNRFIALSVHGDAFAELSHGQVCVLDQQAAHLMHMLPPPRRARVGCSRNGAGEETFLRDVVWQRLSPSHGDLLRSGKYFASVRNLMSGRTRQIDRPLSEATARFDTLLNCSRPSSFSLEFRGVSKSFGTKVVLDNVSFKVHRGQFVGIVGASGAGKTTILNLILRIYDPDAGEILLNNRPISDFPVRQLRRRIAYVCQDFNENGFSPELSIEANLALGDLSRDNIKDAIASALQQADADSVVASKPLKLKTPAVQRIFSGGESQRLVIARAMMRNPQTTGLLVLDEATSALDGATEKLVVGNMLGGRRLADGAALASRISCIAVAHRLATLTEADKILVLDEGKIREQGTWSSLARNKESLFYQLLSLQTVRGESLQDDGEDMSSGMPSRSFTLSSDNAASCSSPGKTSEQEPALAGSAADAQLRMILKTLSSHSGVDDAAKHVIRQLLTSNTLQGH